MKLYSGDLNHLFQVRNLIYAKPATERIKSYIYNTYIQIIKEKQENSTYI